MKSHYLCLLFFLSFLSPALAGADVWYTTSEQKGECGEECYVPPSAWIDDAKGIYSFGVTCDSTMILGGSAMQKSEPPFSETTIVIDEKTLGRFSVENGLSDVYVRPTNGNRYSLKDMQAALESGSILKLVISGKPPVKFVLSGSKTAIRSTNKACKRS